MFQRITTVLHWLSIPALAGLLLLSQTSYGQSTSDSERTALARIAAEQIGQAETVAQPTSGKPMLTIAKVNPALPHGDIFLAVAAKGTVEQFPTLASGGGVAALVETIQRQVQGNGLKRPSGSNEKQAFVSFTVEADGRVQSVQLAQGLDTAFDTALIAAVQGLPRLVPGQTAGQAVAVRLTLPVKTSL